jgi:hypothetical protein
MSAMTYRTFGRVGADFSAAKVGTQIKSPEKKTVKVLWTMRVENVQAKLRLSQWKNFRSLMGDSLDPMHARSVFHRFAAMSHNPTEHVQEELHHHAAHGHEHGHGLGHGGSWITAAATTAAILAALAAAAGALATRHLTQSMLIRIRANDDWNYYQAKSIKSSLLDTKIYSAQLVKTEPRKADLDKKNDYAREMPEIQASAKSLEKLSRQHLETHETFEGSATMFHIAIAVVAIAVVARRKEFWFLSMVGGAVGLFFLTKAFIHAPPALEAE